MSRRGLRAVVSILALVLVGSLGLAAPAAGSGIVAATPPATVHLDGLTPSAPTDTDTLTFTGTVTNDSDGALTALNAYLRMSSIPLESADDLPRLDDPDFRPGFRTQYFAPVIDSIGPGGSAEFKLGVSMANLNLREQGVYVVGIEIRATVPDGSREAVGTTMTVLPYVPDPSEIGTVGVAWVWPLTARVERSEDGAFLDDALGAAMEGDGALGAAFVAAADTPVTWLVDPAVAQAAADMADGYMVRTSTQSTAGAHAEAAATWLASLRAAALLGRVALLPYGDVDAVALTRAGMGRDLASALTVRSALDDDLVPGAVDDVGFTPGGLLDTPTLDALGAAGIRRVLVATDGLDTPLESHAPHAALRSGERTFDAIRLETPAGASVVAIGQPSAIQQRQLLLAQTALAAMSSMPISGETTQEARTLVLTPPGGQLTGQLVGSLLEISTTAPWVTSATLADAARAPAIPGKLAYPPEARAAELAPAYLAQVATLRQRVDTLAALTDSHDDDVAQATPAAGASIPTGSATTPSQVQAATAITRELLVLRAESAAWRSDTEGARTAIAAQVAVLDKDLGSVHIASTGSVTLSSSRGRFPLTVQNGLDQAVTVQIDLQPQTPARLRMSKVPAVSIGAGQLATVNVDAEAGTNGVFLVDVQLLAPNGASVGPPTVLTLRATEYDTVAWIVIIVAGVLLFAAAGVRIIRRVIRARSRATS